MAIVAEMKKNSDFSLLEDIPAEFLKDKSEINKLTATFYKKLNSKPKTSCLFPGCTEPTINSHSLQKALLRSIADSTNHVFRIKINVDYRLNGKITRVIDTISVNKASTFLGYCNTHDTEIFKPIEQGVIDPKNTEHHFLLVLRSIAREFFESKKSYLLLASIVGEIIKDLKKDDIMIPFLISQQYIKYLELFHVEKIKNFFDICYQEGRYNNIFEYSHIEFNKCLPVFVNTFTAIQAMNNGITFTRDIRKEMPLYLSMTILPSNEKTDVFYAVLKKQVKELTPFLGEFKISNLAHLETFITDTILRNTDNFYVSPEFWNSIPNTDRDTILDLFYRTINNRAYLTKNVNIFDYIMKT